ncbi:chromatin assembly factor 1 subunit a caf-1 subunit a [Holotrichia oblita]|uniref:Chromatin assembly factor 1 subunit a caf-1 subunit a n=1 Tax=Holotrichia oblita TaxID=644536 RepID=A0ACB9T0M0_HOLOL|nr:chromatin assembly factor 1 subunit a caf-1 subunit a [Holotrichia oblita]
MMSSRISYSMHYDLTHAQERVLAPLQELSRLRIDTREPNMPVLYVAMATWIPKCNMYHHNSNNNSEPEAVENGENETIETSEGIISKDPKTDSDRQDSTSSKTESESDSEDGAEDISPSKVKTKADDLKITPKKVLSPKQLLRKAESEKKRQEKQKEKEEIRRKKLELKEEKDRQKLEEKKKLDEERRKANEEKLRLKQEKEDQKLKEKQAKEEEKDKKRREKEEKEEAKKKEREQLKLKKQQELEEKNKEKLKIEEQKQKTVAAFVNFFVPKKADANEEKRGEDSSTFMPFEIKSDMRLAPLLRRTLDDDRKDELDEKLNEQNGGLKLYLQELKEGGARKIGRSSSRTWPFEEADSDDLIIVEENVGESIVEQKPKLEKMRAKFLKFHENQRPPYFGTWNKRSKKILARRPFEKDEIFNYDIDSDEEWEEEGEGESLKGTDDEEEKDNESDHDYEEDEVFVPHGYLSDDETNDEVKAKLSPSAHKAKLKLLKNEFDEEMRSKTQKLKPRVIGCVWYNKDGTNVEEAIDRYLQPFSIICKGQIQIKKRSDFVLASTKKAPKQLDKEHIPIFLKLIHGSVDKRKNIVKDFIEHMSNNGIQLEVSQMSLSRLLKTFAQWQKCPEDGAMHNKLCWYVGEDVRKEYNVNLAMPIQVKNKYRKTTK